ncbi:MAG: response regulator [Nitrospirota bacterium]|nr:response regulator [Nitrospirota bacterium]MDH5585862.1 response regulator [Nitrospirota bacterium]MDH5773697.1 response regulator [Nitrospirota bacterium]
MRALVIDDSKAMRIILKQILQSVGGTVEEAGNGKEGLEKLHTIEKPDVVLVDWNMPEMNGLDFVRAVRANPSYRQLPLMMVTTETESAQMGRALAAGANEYVMKPFTKDVIQEKLKILGIK